MATCKCISSKACWGPASCCHSTMCFVRTPVLILAVLFPIRLLASVLGKHWKMTQDLGLCYSHTRVMAFQAPSFSLTCPSCCGHLGSQPLDARFTHSFLPASPSVSLPAKHTQSTNTPSKNKPLGLGSVFTVHCLIKWLTFKMEPPSDVYWV